MLRGLIELLGAFFAAAPVSVDEGRRGRIAALLLIVVVLAICGWSSLQP